MQVIDEIMTIWFKFSRACQGLDKFALGVTLGPPWFLSIRTQAHSSIIPEQLFYCGLYVDLLCAEGELESYFV